MAQQQLLTGADVLHTDGRIEPADVLLDGARIAAVGHTIERPGGAEVIDLAGLTLCPGFIDLHVHGGGGYSLATRDPDEIRAYARWVASRGVTGFLATIAAGSLDEALDFARTAAPLVGQTEGLPAGEAGAELLGLNFEGPFVSPDRRGALPSSWVSPPSIDAFERILDATGGTLRLMTVAPEVPGARDIVHRALDVGVVVSIGHTDATFDEALLAFRPSPTSQGPFASNPRQSAANQTPDDVRSLLNPSPKIQRSSASNPRPSAVNQGASHVTHAFNAMRPFHHRDPGVLGAALSHPHATVEVIADGVHIHPATVEWLVRAFGPDRVCLVTDGVTPAGLGFGAFRIGGHEARLEGDAILLPDGTIAGSAATMDAAVRNVVTWGAATLPDALRMASETPARALGLEGEKGRIGPGFHADLVALDAGLAVSRTWVAGRILQ